jgi:hypothetical protein
VRFTFCCEASSTTRATVAGGQKISQTKRWERLWT